LDFYYLVDVDWVHLVELGHLNHPVEGVLPLFGEILGTAIDVDPADGFFLVVESGNNFFWWSF
jgi:hypothetical protein